MFWEKIKTGAVVAEVVTGKPEDQNGSKAYDVKVLRDSLHALAKEVGLGPASVQLSDRYSDYVTGSWVELNAASYKSVAVRIARHFSHLRWWKVSFSAQPDKNFFMFTAYRTEHLSPR